MTTTSRTLPAVTSLAPLVPRAGAGKAIASNPARLHNDAALADHSAVGVEVMPVAGSGAGKVVEQFAAHSGSKTGAGGELTGTAATSPITTQAPGKLFLLGEYAVLFGAPAVVMAVDRYVMVTIERSHDHYHAEFVGAQMPAIEGKWQHDHLAWQDAEPRHELLTTLCAVLAEVHILDAATAPFRIVVDSQELCHSGIKLGLGSSAAVANAVVRAVLEYTGNDVDCDRAHQLVFEAHFRFQNGVGSGADVAAGLAGGLLVYERAKSYKSPLIKKLQPADGWYMSGVWVGRPASTTSAIRTMEKFRATDEPGFNRVLAPLMSGAAKGAAALIGGDGAEFLAACQAYCHDLSDFGRIVGIDVMSEAHTDCRKIADTLGVVYKTSGAGDGDYGVALSNDINRLQDFEDHVVAAGYRLEVFKEGQPCHTVRDR